MPEELPPFLTVTKEGLLLRVHVQPRAKRAGVAGLHGDSLKLKVQAPPADGAANRACVELLARLLKVPKRSVSLRSGHRSREKTFLVEGVDPARLKGLLDGGG